MTCIIGVVDKKKKRVIFGTDSQTSSTKMIIPVRKRNGNRIKICKYKGIDDLIVGFAGNTSINDYIKYSLDFRKGLKDDEELIINKPYLMYNIIPQISETVSSFKKLRDEKNKKFSFMIIIGYKDKLFTISNNFEVYEYNDFCSIGIDPVQTESILEIYSEMDISYEELITKTLMKVEDVESGVGYPFYIGYSNEETILLKRANLELKETDIKLEKVEIFDLKKYNKKEDKEIKKDEDIEKDDNK